MPTKRAVLCALPKSSLAALADEFDVDVADRRVREKLVQALARSHRATLPKLLGELSRDTLKEACSALGLDAHGRDKALFVERLLGHPQMEDSAKDADAKPASDAPTLSSVLHLLARSELLDIVDTLQVEVPERRSKLILIASIKAFERVSLPAVLGLLGRDALKTICRCHDLPDTGRERAVIIARILEASEYDEGDAEAPSAPEHDQPGPSASEPVSGTVSEAADPPCAAPERTPSVDSVLEMLTRARLIELGRTFDVAVPSDVKAKQVASLRQGCPDALEKLLQHLSRDEVKAACRSFGLDSSGRARRELSTRLLQAAGHAEATPPRQIFDVDPHERFVPVVGDIVNVRRRQYLVQEVVPPPAEGDATLVRLVCLDDDNQGRELDVLWELELGARILQPQSHGLGNVEALDEPRRFAAYLHALKWKAVTATDAELFQAPFRAGIRLQNHQLAPLKKALKLPRANLFIADDVGLGKTIEAGLVLQELLLRQRVSFALIVCPASISLQWRDEMQKRFGIHFEVYSRAFVARMRRERGFGINPWTTHSRFIISYQTLRRPEHRDPLIAHVGERVKKSLLILDEAHTAAPASASKYAIDSRLTRVVRDIAPRFENRLFLSATPHNGHSNSFSALLEILDPQRFTRGVPVQSRAQLEPVMVRRLKGDLAALPGIDFPKRRVIQVDVQREGSDGAWACRFGDDAVQAIGRGEGAELKLTELLEEYTELMRPKKGRGELVFINLQKRLLSSIEAFCRTLNIHVRSVGSGKAATALKLAGPRDDESDRHDELDEYGPDDEALAAEDDARVASGSGLLDPPEKRARTLLDEMLRLAERHRDAPDGKVLALLHWIRTHQCPAVGCGDGGCAQGASLAWRDRRVIVFTEYADTKRYLRRILEGAISHTEAGEERILELHGGMSDEGREEVQRAFNAPPDAHPVRILLATDAAREGVNLQGQCADLFHFDIPWNPARMEQRNGRIDRTMQPASEVRCHYFHYPERHVDVVLQKLVTKVDVITRELGSLGQVVIDRLAMVMERGIDARTPGELDRAEQLDGRREVVEAELEAERRERQRLVDDIEHSGKLLNRSQDVLEFKPALLRDAINVGLELAGLEDGLEEIKDASHRDNGPTTYALPELPESWQGTLDTLRVARGRDEHFWEWRKKPPLPVVFKAPNRLDETRVHLHLQHPFVQRILSRFVAQGFSAHDLSRVTVVPNPRDGLCRVIAFGRLSLFGPGASRLHDELVSVAAAWLESGGKDHLKPFASKADKKALETLDSLLSAAPRLKKVSASITKSLAASAKHDFAALWPHIKNEADNRAHAAERALSNRGEDESAALRQILETQRRAIHKALADAPDDRQLKLLEADYGRAELEQLEQDRKHMQKRLEAINREIEDEPAQIRELYKVVLHRLEPVGLIYLWPETRL